MGRLNIVHPDTGDVTSIDEAAWPTHKNLGYTIEATAAQASRAVRAGKIEGYGVNTIAGKTKLVISEALGGLSLGATQILEAQNPSRREEMQLGREENPTLATVSNIGAAVIPALASGGASLGASAARATLPGQLSRLGSRIIESGAQRGVLGRAGTAAVAGVVEAVPAAVGGYLATTAIKDREVTAEGLLGSVRDGALFGGGGGAVFSLGSSVLTASRKLFPKGEVSEVAATEAKRAATTEIRGSLLDTSELHTSGRREVNIHRHGRVIADPEAAAKAETIRLAREQRDSFAQLQTIDEAKLIAARSSSDPVKPKVGRARGKPKAAAPEAAAPEPPTFESVPKGAVVDATIPPEALASRIELPGAGADKVKTSKAQKAISDGQQDPVTLAVHPDGRYEVVDGRHRIAAAIEQGKPIKARVERAYVPPDDLEAALGQSVSRLKGGDSIQDLSAAARPADKVKTWNPMLNRHIVGGGSASDLAQRAGRGGAPPKMFMRKGKLVPEDEFGATANRTKPVDREIDDAVADYNPQVARVRDATDELEDAREAMARAVGDGEPDLGALLGQSVSRLQAGESIGALARAGRPVTSGADVLASSVPRTPTPEAVETALRGRLDAADDLAAAIPAIQRFEAAEARMVDVLGAANVPPGSARRAAAYRQAQAAHSETTALADSQAAAAIGDAAALPMASAATKGSLAGNAADAGAMLEVLSSLEVPGLPSVKNIPFIGPVLSMYLKARAATAVWRRLGGKLPASVETQVASRSSAVRDRMAMAVDQLVGKVERGTRAALPAAPLAAEVLGRRLFADERDDKHKVDKAPIGELLARRADELQRALQPGALVASIRDRVRTSDPELAQALVATAERKVTYLNNHIPRPPPGDALGVPWQPAKADVERFAGIVDALDDPAGVLERAVGGDVSIDQIKAIRSVYPKLYAEAQQQLLMAVVDGSDIPYRRRIQLGYLFSVPLDPTSDPVFWAKQQAGMAPPPPAGAPPVPSIAGPMDLASAVMLQEMR